MVPQVDRFGNLNTTVIGPYEHPRVRLPGSGGAAEIAINASRVFHVLRLSRRSFVERLDFVTSPGHDSGRGGHEEAKLAGAGPQLVVTDLAIFDFANPEREMQLTCVHPGVTVAQVREQVGWDLRVASVVRETLVPSAEELRVLREELDSSKAQ